MGLIPYTYHCYKCQTPMSTEMVRCPGCASDFGFIAHPTSPQALAKKDKHEELVTYGSISLGDGPGGFNASFDFNGVASMDKLVRYTLAFGHRTQISSGPGRTSSDIVLAYVPEIIGSGISNFISDYEACSGICLISPASEKWAHPFPAMDNWVKSKAPLDVWICTTCMNPVPFGHPFCTNCYAKHGADWRTFVV